MTSRHEFVSALHAERRAYGPYSPIGSRLSQLEQVTGNIDKPELADRRSELIARAEATAMEIAAIKSGAPADTQIRPRASQPPTR